MVRNTGKEEQKLLIIGDIFLEGSRESTEKLVRGNLVK